MEKQKVLVTKQYEGCWMVWTVKRNGSVKCVDIETVEDYFMGAKRRRYRVVFAGKIIGNLIEHFQTARKIARNALLT